MKKQINNVKAPFEMKDVQDVRFIVKAKDQHYGFVPKKTVPAKIAHHIRIGILNTLLKTHDVVVTPLESIMQA